MPRVIWKGSISFGLVHVPISLYSAEARGEELHLSMLDSRDLSPVGYKRINKTTGEDVTWDQIVKGYEYEKGEYVVLDEEDFRQANVEATQTVEIVDFVSQDEIPVTYFDRPYYLEPLKKGEKGYALLRETLRRTQRIGIAKVVLRAREHIAALLPHRNALVLNLLRYAYELRDVDDLKLPTADLAELRISDKELAMAERLVKDMVVDWEPEKYRDEYRDDLMRLIENKLSAGQTQVGTARGEAPPTRTADVVDLMSLLKKSVEAKERPREGKERPRASSRGTARKSSSRKKKSSAKKRA